MLRLQSRAFFSLGSSGSQAKVITLHRTLPYTQSELFAVISNVQQYSAFLPYCIASQVTQVDAATALPTRADLVIGYGGFQETFASRIECARVEGRVVAEAVRPELFQQLKAVWQLEGRGGLKRAGGTRASLDITYYFTNPLYNMACEAMGPQIAKVLMDAFESRVHDVVRHKV